MNRYIPAYWMRGGTSKGLFLCEDELYCQPNEKDRLLLKIMGSPDPYGKQIDGLGGATSSTSKVCMVSPSLKQGFDVDYLFGHVSIKEAKVDYSGNCGNLSSAVGVYAMERGWVAPVLGGITSVRIWQRNLHQKLIVSILTDIDGRVVTQGDYAIAGIPGSYAPVNVDFIRPGGGDNGAVLPTGRPTDIIDVSHLGQIEVSLIDAGNATVFIQAETLGLQGTELPDQLSSSQRLLQDIESIRCHAAVMMGKSETLEAAHRQPATPKLAIVSAARSYTDSQGKHVREKDIDLCSRIFSMGHPHHAYTGTGAIALAVAAKIPGTVVQRNIHHGQKVLKFGHVAGVMESHAEVELVNHVWIALAAGITRTARVLMRGEIFIPIWNESGGE